MWSLTTFNRKMGLRMSTEINSKAPVRPRRSAKVWLGAGCAMIGLVASSAASAQTGGTATGEGGEGATIVVTGIRASLDTALQIKRDATEIVDSINAEDAGKFPDQNVAESLQRVSGIQIQRGSDDTAGSASGNGEGSRVSVRGLRPDLAKVLLNGNTLSSTSGGRDFDFSNLPSELISAVAVYKSASASQEEGGIGGVINVQTRSPLKTGKTMLVGMLRGTYQDLSDKINLRASGLVNTVIGANRNLGVLLGVTYTDDDLRRDSIESFGWDTAPAPYTGLIARDFRTNLQNEKRNKLSVNGTIEFEPATNLNIRLDGLYTRQQQQQYASNYQLRIGENSRINSVITNANGTGVFVSTSPSNANQQFHRIVLFDREDNQHTANLTGRIDWTPGNWQVTLRGGYTRGTYARDPALNVLFTASSAMSYDLRSGDPWPVLTSTATNPYQPVASAFRVNSVNRALNSRRDVEKFGNLDISRDLDGGFFSSVRIGAKIGDRDISFEAKGVGVAATALTGLTLADFATSFPATNFLGFVDSPNLPRSWPFPDAAALRLRFPFDTVLANPVVRTQDATQNYSVREKALAGYAQLDIDSGKLRGNLGIRVVRTNQDNTGFILSGTTITPTTSSRSYTNALPSINLNYELADKVLLRFAASKAMSRATFAELSNAATVNAGAGTATLGNPNLDPYKSNNLDLSVEWYFAKGGLLSAGLFLKDVNSFVTTAQTREVLPGLGTDPFLVNRPINGSAKVKGFELAYQHNFTFLPAPFDGLGILANYTFVDTKSTFADPVSGGFLPMPGASKHSGNIVAFYEKDWFSTRLAYNRRSKFILFPQSLGGQNVTRRAYGQLDGTMSFDVSKKLSIVLQATNLTKASNYDYAGVEERWVAYRNTGRTFSVEARAKF